MYNEIMRRKFTEDELDFLTEISMAYGSSCICLEIDDIFIEISTDIGNELKIVSTNKGLLSKDELLDICKYTK